MRRFPSSCILALLLAFLPLLAMASEQHKHVTLDQKAEVGNQQLTPGQYTVKFDDSSKNPQVQFVRDGKTVATVPAEIQHKANVDRAQFEFNTSNGQNRLDSLFLSDNEELVFSPGATQTSTNQNTTSPTQ